MVVGIVGVKDLAFLYTKISNMGFEWVIFTFHFFEKNGDFYNFDLISIVTFVFFFFGRPQKFLESFLFQNFYTRILCWKKKSFQHS